MKQRAPWSARVLVLGAALALSAPGCAGRSSKPALPPRPHVVPVALTEYRFEYPKPSRPGRVVFTLQNVGREDHSMTVLPLPEKFPPIDEQLRGGVRRVLTPIMKIEVPFQSSATFAVDLRPGRYALVCEVVSRDGVSDALKGMTSEFRIS